MDREDHTAQEECASADEFERALDERYRRLSLLTLDLAEEAGEAAVNFSLVDTKGVRPAFFDRRLAAMTRAIWAHRVIERLRGAPAAKAADARIDAKAATPSSAAKAAFSKASAPSRAGMASMVAVGKNAADCAPTLEADLDNRWTPRPHTNAANPRSAAKAAARGTQSTRSNPDEKWTQRPPAKAAAPRASAPP